MQLPHLPPDTPPIRSLDAGARSASRPGAGPTLSMRGVTAALWRMQQPPPPGPGTAPWRSEVPSPSRSHSAVAGQSAPSPLPTRFYDLSGCLVVCAQMRSGNDESMDMDGGGDWDVCVLEFFLTPDCRDHAARKTATDVVVATIMEQFGSGDLKVVVIGGLQDLAFDIIADGKCVLRLDLSTMVRAPHLGLNDHGGDERDSDEEGLHLVVAMGTTTEIEAFKMHHDEHHGGVGKKMTKR